MNIARKSDFVREDPSDSLRRDERIITAEDLETILRVLKLPVDAIIDTVHTSGLVGRLSFSRENPLMYKLHDSSYERDITILPCELTRIKIGANSYRIAREGLDDEIDTEELSRNGIIFPVGLISDGRSPWETREPVGAATVIKTLRGLAADEVVIIVDNQQRELVGFAELTDSHRVAINAFNLQQTVTLDLDHVLKIKRLNVFCTKESDEVCWTPAKKAYDALCHTERGDLIDLLDNTGLRCIGEMISFRRDKGILKLLNATTALAPELSVSSISRINSISGRTDLAPEDYTERVTPRLERRNVELVFEESVDDIREVSEYTPTGTPQAEPPDEKQQGQSSISLDDKADNPADKRAENSTPTPITKEQRIIEQLKSIAQSDRPAARIRFEDKEVLFALIKECDFENGTLSAINLKNREEMHISVKQIAAVAPASQGAEGRTLLSRYLLAEAPQDAFVRIQYQGEVCEGWIRENNFRDLSSGRLAFPNGKQRFVYASQIPQVLSVSEPDVTAPAPYSEKGKLLLELLQIGTKLRAVADIRYEDGNSHLVKVSVVKERGYSWDALQLTHLSSGEQIPLQADKIISVTDFGKVRDNRNTINRSELAAIAPGSSVTLALNKAEGEFTATIVENRFAKGISAKFIEADGKEHTTFLANIDHVIKVEPPSVRVNKDSAAETQEREATSDLGGMTPLATPSALEELDALGLSDEELGAEPDSEDSLLGSYLTIPRDQRIDAAQIERQREEQRRYFTAEWEFEDRSRSDRHRIREIIESVREEREMTGSALFDNVVITFKDGLAVRGVLAAGNWTGLKGYRIIDVDNEKSYDFTPDNVKSIRFP